MGWRQELGRSAVVGAAKAGKQLETLCAYNPYDSFVTFYVTPSHAV